jgi:hypothetical protein
MAFRRSTVRSRSAPPFVGGLSDFYYKVTFKTLRGRRRFGDDAKTLSQTQNLINLQARKSLPGGLLSAVSR